MQKYCSQRNPQTKQFLWNISVTTTYIHCCVEGFQAEKEEWSVAENQPLRMAPNGKSEVQLIKSKQAQQTQARSGSLSISGGFCLAYMRGVTSLFWDAPLLIFYLLSVYFGIGP